MSLFGSRLQLREGRENNVALPPVAEKTSGTKFETFSQLSTEEKAAETKRVLDKYFNIREPHPLALRDANTLVENGIFIEQVSDKNFRIWMTDEKSSFEYATYVYKKGKDGKEIFDKPNRMQGKGGKYNFVTITMKNDSPTILGPDSRRTITIMGNNGFVDIKLPEPAK